MREFSQKYLSLLTGEFAGLNLTRIVTEEDFYQKQILDSLLPLQHSTVFRDSFAEGVKLLDVGFGGGIPLLPLAHDLPGVDCLGLEARNKKALAVGRIAESLGLKNVRLLHGRLEEFLLDCPVVLTFKAVGGLRECLEKVRGTGSVRAFFYKGPRVRELESLDFLRDSSWKQIEEKSYLLPNGSKRIFFGFERVFLPRECLAKHKKLVNLTQVI